jgi:hypothetical protein
MRLKALLVTVLMAQRLLNLPHGFDPLGARLALPEHHKALPAYAAMRLRKPSGAFT